ncbi:MAG TPA: hypothetical protein VIU82_00280 [Bosea sp. (in: a-proteobacteria)]
MTECEEIADNIDIDLEKIRTFSEACAVITERAGAPSEIGFTIHANMAEALYDRAHLARRKRIAAEMRSLS